MTKGLRYVLLEFPEYPKPLQRYFFYTTGQLESCIHGMKSQTKTVEIFLQFRSVRGAFIPNAGSYGEEASEKTG